MLYEARKLTKISAEYLMCAMQILYMFQGGSDMSDYVWLYMIMYNYIWLCMITYDYVWLCMIMYEYVWLCMIQDPPNPPTISGTCLSYKG